MGTSLTETDTSFATGTSLTETDTSFAMGTSLTEEEENKLLEPDQESKMTDLQQITDNNDDKYRLPTPLRDNTKANKGRVISPNVKLLIAAASIIFDSWS